MIFAPYMGLDSFLDILPKSNFEIFISYFNNLFEYRILFLTCEDGGDNFLISNFTGAVEYHLKLSEFCQLIIRFAVRVDLYRIIVDGLYLMWQNITRVYSIIFVTYLHKGASSFDNVECIDIVSEVVL
jgi:hypothetical protein